MNLGSRRNGRAGRGAFRHAVWIIAVSFLLLVSQGCGRKGPPVAPHLQAPVAVKDLSAKVVDCTVELGWTVPPASEAAWPDGYRIYRARLGVEDCEGCPMLFQRIGDVSLHETARPASGSPWALKWKDEVVAGFRYVYKVSAYGDGQREGVDSNLVNVRP